MKHRKPPWKHNGKCYVCGKPTTGQMVNHVECGKKIDAQTEATPDRLLEGLTPSQKRRNQRHYIVGRLPNWMYE